MDETGLTSSHRSTGRWITGPVALLASWVIFLQACTTIPPEPPKTWAERPPEYGTDGCSYWENVGGGTHVWFQSGSDKILQDDRNLRFLESVVSATKEDPGNLLVSTFLSTAETKTARIGLATARAVTIRDYLVAHGIPLAAIWIRPADRREPYDERVFKTDAEHANMAVIRNTRRGRACFDARRHARREWFQKNCFPVVKGPINDCFVALRRMDEGG